MFFQILGGATETGRVAGVVVAGRGRHTNGNSAVAPVVVLVLMLLYVLQVIVVVVVEVKVLERQNPPTAEEGMQAVEC